jgi:hypothetical protein
MISMDMKVNGVLIGHIYCHNEGSIHMDNVLDLCQYYWEYHKIGERKSKIQRGCVSHRRKEGALKLFSLIIKDILHE